MKFLEICKQFSFDLVHKRNITRRRTIPRFSYLGVVILCMTTEVEERDSENCLFESKQAGKDTPNFYITM